MQLGILQCIASFTSHRQPHINRCPAAPVPAEAFPPLFHTLTRGCTSCLLCPSHAFQSTLVFNSTLYTCLASYQLLLKNWPHSKAVVQYLPLTSISSKRTGSCRAVVAHAFNPSIQEAERQVDLYKFKDSQGY